MSNTTTGGVAGGALGAGLGTLVGAATGNPKTGAVVGGLMGAGVGTAIGADVDREERSEIRRTQAEISANQAAAAQARQALSIDDIVSMSKPNPQSGTRVGDEVIVDAIRNSGARYELTPADIRYLTDCGVSDRVIREMMNARPPARVAVTRPQRVIVEEAPPVVIYERPWGYRPYYVGPPPIGFGFQYTRIR